MPTFISSNMTIDQAPTNSSIIVATETVVTGEPLHLGPVWFPVLLCPKKLWPLITVLNKTSLQNQLQNPEESNEAFDRVIRE